jgi:hypothetical protein
VLLIMPPICLSRQAYRPRVGARKKNDKLVEDYLASKAAFKDYQPIVVDADFQITFFFDHGKPASAGDLNAALTLVLSR